MSKYVLILDKEEPIEELLKQNFPEHYQINGHAWGIRTHASSTEISEKIFPKFLLDLKSSIAKLEERTDNQTSEIRAIRSEMIGKTAFWAAVSLIIAVMLGLASIYFSTQDSARLSKISPERHAPHQKGSGLHTSP